MVSIQAARDMTQRVLITNDKFRVTVPGVDVNSAEDYEFVLHEGHLSAQAYFIMWVPCPLTGTSSTSRSTRVTITTAPITNDTVVILYPASSSSVAHFPSPPFDSVGNPTGARCYFDPPVSSGTTLRITFGVPENVPAPSGAFVVFLRGSST